MDRFENYINLILKGSFTGKILRSELEDEIRDHLEMSKKELINAGYSEEESEFIAVQKFGKAASVKKRFRKIYPPNRSLKEIIRKNFVRELLEWTATFAGALIIALSVRSYAFASTEVKQCSMQNTLFEGQRLIESKIEYYYSTPQRGDIVIINQKLENKGFAALMDNSKEFFEDFFKKEDNEKNRLIKRVIGIPGDSIDIKDGKIYINGQSYYEPYVKGITLPNQMKFPIVIPSEKYFVLGDNRENSMDSREIGLISIQKIEGKAVLRLWPIDKLGTISN